MTHRVPAYVFGLLALLLCVSCSPLEPLKSNSSVPTSGRKMESEQSPSSGKMMTGAVSFEGLDDQELSQFRVIPEKGRVPFVPKNQRYPEVDGFWWKAKRNRWFKIPDHGEAWVGDYGEAPPFKSDGNERLGEAQVYWRSNPALRWASGLRGVAEPGFYPNAGRTKIGVPYPF